MQKQNKAICVFTADPSLNFLDSIKRYLSENYDCIEIQPSYDSHQEAINKLNEIEDNSILILIGHGASHCFYGASNESYPQKSFINNSNIEILHNKHIFSFSCRSNEFLSSNRTNIKNYIGFGNMPTDWNEILAERDNADPNYLKGLTPDDIEYYKTTLCDIILKSFQSIDDITNFKRLYLLIKLHTNKAITDLLIKKTVPNYRLIADLLYEFKVEIIAELINIKPVCL